MKTVVILDDYQNVALKMADWSRIAGRAKLRVLDRHIADRDELIRELADAHALVCNRERTPIDAGLIAALPQLELIVTSGMRNASIDIAAAQARSIPVCGTATLGYPTAELTVAMILGFFRHLPQEVAAMSAGGWQTTLGRGLRGKTLGVVGYGRIGRDVGRVALALGMQVLGYSRSLTPERAADDGVVCADLDPLLRESDVVSIHLAVNAKTRGLIGAAELAKMKPTALLVNTARSVLVDQEAMVRALVKRLSCLRFRAGMFSGWRKDIDAMDQLVWFPQDAASRATAAIRRLFAHSLSKAKSPATHAREECTDHIRYGRRGSAVRLRTILYVVAVFRCNMKDFAHSCFHSASTAPETRKASREGGF